MEIGNIKISSGDDDEEGDGGARGDGNGGAKPPPEPKPMGERKRQRDHGDSDGDDSQTTITIKRLRLDQKIRPELSGDDSSGGDYSNGGGPVLRPEGVSSWIVYRDMKPNEDDKTDDQAQTDLNPETYIDDKNSAKPNQDQVDAIGDGTKANTSSPELVFAMEDVLDGLTRCQLED